MFSSFTLQYKYFTALATFTDGTTWNDDLVKFSYSEKAYIFWKDHKILLTRDIKYYWIFFKVFVAFLEDLNFNIATGLSVVMIHYFFIYAIHQKWWWSKNIQCAAMICTWVSISLNVFFFKPLRSISQSHKKNISLIQAWNHSIYILGQYLLPLIFFFVVVHSFPSWLVWGRKLSVTTPRAHQLFLTGSVK